MSTPTFHQSYAGLLAGLPPSQLREAHKRLTKCKHPLTAEEISSEDPRILACLERLVASYGRKKGRSAVSSKARRDAAREQTTDSANRGDPANCAEEVAVITESLPTQEPPNGLASLLEACDIVCVSEDEEPSTSAVEPVELEDVNIPPPLPPPLRRESTEAPAVAQASPSPAKPTPRSRRRLVRPAAVDPEKGTASGSLASNSLVSRR